MVMSTFLAWFLVNPILPVMDLPRDAQPPQALPPSIAACACGHAKDACKTACLAGHERMVTCVYQVADLVVPIAHTPPPAPTSLPVAAKPCAAPSVSCTCGPPQQTTEDRLMVLIRTKVAPGSWIENGGAASMDYYPIGMTLVVRQTPACQEQIAALLDRLRRAQDMEVVVEVRVIEVPDHWSGLSNDFQRNAFMSGGITCQAKNAFTPDLGFPSMDNASGTPRFLDNSGLRSFLKTTLADRRTNVLSMPKLTVANGQDATIQTTEQQYFVTNLTEKRLDGQAYYLPRNQAFTTGMTLHVQPVVSADRRYVQMKLSIQDTELAIDPPAMTPVTTFITPVFEGGSVGQPIPFTQYLQRPVFAHHHFDHTVAVPNGNTVVFLGWQQKRPAKPLVPEVLRDLPFLSCMFLNACSATEETKSVLVLVTPHVLNEHETELKPPARVVDAAPKAGTIVPAKYEEAVPAPADTRLQELLMYYQVACDHGDRAVATQCAVRALAIDPMCFQKKAR